MSPFLKVFLLLTPDPLFRQLEDIGKGLEDVKLRLEKIERR